MTARTWGLPEEPVIGTRVRDVTGLQWYRPNSAMWTRVTRGPWLTWEELVFSHGPLTEVIAPELPTEDGALIIASGTSDGEPFENKVLVRRGAGWRGDVATGGVSPGLVSFDDEITSWVEAVAVPKDKLDALREAAYDGEPEDLIDAAHALVDGVQ